ncbi:MAG: DUF3575 domain-containing protein [Prevotella sp.]|nr:DUF3575 domain-containing protein [Prevotella sp.]
MRTYRVHIIVVVLLLMAVAGRGQSPVSADSVRLVRSGGSVQLSLKVVLDGTPLSRHDVVVLTPRLVSATDSIDFPPIVVFGRNAYYHDVRHGTTTADIPANAYRLRYKGAPRSEHYATTIGWQPWMEHARLRLILQQGDPCDLRCLGMTDTVAFAPAPPDTTIVVRQRMEQEEPTGIVSGKAWIQFIVNKTDFEPTLADNQRELQKMHQSITDVQNDRRVSITKYRLKGYASPEGPWDNNVRLARERTECIRRFMVDQWGVPPSQIETDSEPEDWQGMRDYVDRHRDIYPNADAIISIIDSDMKPDPKLARIAAEHPEAYRRLLKECFPRLRHTDYSIDYEGKDVEERQSTAVYDTIVTPRPMDADGTLMPDIVTRMTPSRPWLALKTNMLFDLLLTPNVEVEVPIGQRWSVMVEDWFPWLLHNKGRNLSIGRYITPGNDMKTSAYEVLTVGVELRYWYSRVCPQSRPRLTGPFLALYYANGKYDIERNSKGDQGEFNSVGVTWGYSWPLARHWNLEASVSAGYLWGPRRHYEGEYNDTHLIWKYTGRTSYIGPTKLKLSIVWLLPSFHKKKGGAHE